VDPHHPSSSAARRDAALIALAREPDRSAHDLERILADAPGDLGRRVVDHGIAGLAHRHASHLKARFPELLEELDAARRQDWSSHLTKLFDLGQVAAALRDLDGHWAVVKGPVLAERSYRRGDLRGYFDIDLLVAPSCYGDALGLLERAGAVLLDRNWPLIRSQLRGELSLEIHGRTTIDLHWHLLNAPALRRASSWNMDDVLRRAVIADVGPHRVPVLEPLDALVHIAAHACLSGTRRLIWLKDVERQQAAFPVLAADVRARARAAGLWPAVNLALLRAARTFDLPGPAGLTTWSMVNQAVGADRFGTAGRIRNGRTLAAATRPTLPASVAAVGATVLRDTALPWARSRGFAAWLPDPPPTLEDLRRSNGGQADRDAYLAAIDR
jgi:putative nucleotidyltransferase-like protein